MENVVSLFEFIGSLNPFFLSFAIALESILPMVPVSVLMSISVVSYGFFFGFFISYFSTLAGCMLSYMLTRYIFKHYILNHVEKKNKGLAFINRIGNLSLGQIVVLMAFPFAPAFLFNIVSALADMRIKKFVAAIIISKLSLVYFWCFVGKTIYESLNNPFVLLQIVLLILGSYIISKIVEKKLRIS